MAGGSASACLAWLPYREDVWQKSFRAIFDALAGAGSFVGVGRYRAHTPRITESLAEEVNPMPAQIPEPHTFSGRLYGLRCHERTLREELAGGGR
jgi:hypothetical protein